MEIYGLYGITHGGAHLLTLYSPKGRDNLRAHFRLFPHLLSGLRLEDGPGQLLQCHEKTEGALALLVEKFDVKILRSDEWRRLKEGADHGAG